MITASIVADSINAANGKRITSYVLEYPRMIHGELMTHRVFSRNAASSRAIPFKRMVRMIRDNIAMPVKWGTHTAGGMQSGPPATDDVTRLAVESWERAMNNAIEEATYLDGLGIHKSITNRLLEPFAHMTTLVTATEWDNFYWLRVSDQAEPTFDYLATLMLRTYLDNHDHARILMPGQWHIPFLHDDEEPTRAMLPIATARSARTSYINFEGTNDPDKDRDMHNRLAKSGHWSPFEHCAEALPDLTPSGNFIGWGQYRKTFAGENVTGLDLQAHLNKRLAEVVS